MLLYLLYYMIIVTGAETGILWVGEVSKNKDTSINILFLKHEGKTVQVKIFLFF